MTKKQEPPAQPSTSSGEGKPPGDAARQPGEPATQESTTQGGGQGDPKAYDEAYVRQLRDEAAAHRVRAKRADDAERRLREVAIRQHAADILTDPTDLAWSDELADEDGWPEADKITAAATALTTRKPHLGRPMGDIGQGRHDDDQDAVSLGALLRAGA